MATEVYKAASQLEVKLQKITTESWESQGGDTALQAIKTYAKSVYELSGGFRMTEANLRYTADWLYSTKVAMPLSESEPRGCGDDEGDKREAYRIHYVDGLSHTEKLFPVFTEPAAPAGPVEKPKTGRPITDRIHRTSPRVRSNRPETRVVGRKVVAVLSRVVAVLSRAGPGSRVQARRSRLLSRRSRQRVRRRRRPPSRSRPA